MPGMDLTGLVAVVLIFGFVPLMAFAFVLLLVFARRGPRRDRRQDEEEMRWMQQMNDGLTKINDRVDALETLLMDRMQQPKERQGSGRLDP